MRDGPGIDDGPAGANRHDRRREERRGPRGVEHRPIAVDEDHIMLFEPAGTVNTGTVEHAYTVRDPDRI